MLPTGDGHTKSRGTPAWSDGARAKGDGGVRQTGSHCEDTGGIHRGRPRRLSVKSGAKMTSGVSRHPWHQRLPDESLLAADPAFTLPAEDRAGSPLPASARHLPATVCFDCVSKASDDVPRFQCKPSSIFFNHLPRSATVLSLGLILTPPLDRSTTMYYKPNRLIDVPGTDLLTWLFGNEAVHDPDRPVRPCPRKCVTSPTQEADVNNRLVALHRRIGSHQTPYIFPSTHRNQVDDQRTPHLGDRERLMRLSAFVQCNNNQKPS